MAPRTFAIGDIHGCEKALVALLDAIEPQADDCIITLGDYVDRGPNSRAVIDRLIELQQRCRLVPLLGNHELMLLSSLDDLQSLRFWLQCGGAATLESYGGDLDGIPDTHLAFLRECLPFYETDSHILVHANYDPRLPLDQQPERLLFWEHLALHPNGRSTIPTRHFSDKTAVVGHSPQESGEILDLGDVICIDTYCVGSGRLTAYELNSRQVTQTDKHGHLCPRPT